MAFRKPGSKKVAGKFLIYGLTGSGKTVFGLTFPKIGMIDAETGAAWYEGTELGKNLVLIDNSQSFVDLEDTIDELADSHEELGVETFLEDSCTTLNEGLIETLLKLEEKKARLKGRDPLDANVSVRGWGKIGNINNKLQNLKLDLSAKGVNVVSIAQAKEIKKKVGDEWSVVGYEPNMAKGAAYDYDVIVLMSAETQADGTKKFFGTIEKDRTRTFTVNDKIENPHYQMWAKALNQEGDFLNTELSKDSDKDFNRSEKAQAAENASVGDRVKALMAKLAEKDTEKQKQFVAEFKQTGATSLDTFTDVQKEKVENLLQKYE